RSARTRPAEGASIWQYLKVSLSVAVFLLMLGLATLAIILPAMTRSVPMTVLTNSMEPSYPPGTLVIVQPIAPDDVRIGDAVTYQLRSGEPEVVTHRVISIVTDGFGERRFIFKGDNNSEPDDPVIDAQIQGRVWYSLPYLGWVNTWINGGDRSWIAPAVAGALFLYAAWMIISGMRDRMRRKAASGADGTKASGRRRAGVPVETSPALDSDVIRP
ncbi:MAG: signal peptidase I, partial [Protaetiibacter sp.]